MFIYHIVLPQVWERFKDRPSYAPESLTSEGFIHCSYPGQPNNTCYDGCMTNERGAC